MNSEKQLIHFMSLAAADAMNGMQKGDGGPFGALICRNSEIVSIGHNSVFLETDPSAHAEIVAIRLACRQLGRLFLDDCTLISTCEPCPMCLSAVFWARIPRVFYGCTRQDAEEIGFIDNHIYEALSQGHSDEIELKQIDNSHCIPLFRSWQSSQNKRVY